MVELGQPLSKLNSAVEQAALELARTRASSTVEIDLLHENAKFIKRLTSRNQELFSQSVISWHEMDRFETEESVAQMKEQQARSNNTIARLEFRRALEVLNQRTILSPITGVVIDRYKSAGEYVESEPLLRVAQLDPLHIEIFVTADHWGRLLPGQQAEVTPQLISLGKKVATIERIDPVIDSASGTFRVQLLLANPEHLIAAGLKCQLAFLPQKKDVITDDVDNLSSVAQTSTEVSPAMTMPSVTRQSDTTPTNALATETAFDQTIASVTLLTPASLLSRQPLAVASSQPEMPINSCFAVGPVAGEIAQQLTDQLANQSLKLTMQQESRPVVNGYFIHSVPQSDRAKVRAVVVRLKAAKFSDYLVNNDKETNRHWVALGLYQKRENAIDQAKKFTAMGFEVELKSRYQESSAFWLNLSRGNGVAAENELRKIVSHLAPRAEVKQISCEQLLASNNQ
jgi:hypothetical protein